MLRVVVAVEMPLVIPKETKRPKAEERLQLSGSPQKEGLNDEGHDRRREFSAVLGASRAARSGTCDFRSGFHQAVCPRHLAHRLPGAAWCRLASILCNG